jgi:hypothetical protein
VEGNRYFTKFADEHEVEQFKYFRSLDDKQRLEIERMRKE